MTVDNKASFPDLYENSPKIITEMKILVKTWLKERPTLIRKPEDFLELAAEETKEFDRAVKDGSEEEKRLEFGDVLFSLLPSDNRTGAVSVGEAIPALGSMFSGLIYNPSKPEEAAETYISTIPKILFKFKEKIFSKKPGGRLNFNGIGFGLIDYFYSYAFQYCEIKGWNPVAIIEETRQKNSLNYDFALFNKMTPFRKFDDAINFSRLLRNIYGDREQVLTFWKDIASKLNQQPFFDRGHFNYVFREHIKEFLLEASRSGNKDAVNTAKKLLTEGDWGYKSQRIKDGSGW